MVGTRHRLATVRKAPGNIVIPGMPSFDWTNARYQSSYLSFDHKDVDDRNGHRLERLSRTENALLHRFSSCGKLGCDLPLVMIGDYAEDVPGVPTGALISASGGELSFGDVQQALQRGNSPGHYVMFVDEINIEANVITALICHDDGKRPRSVCNRSAIRFILRHVR